MECLTKGDGEGAAGYRDKPRRLSNEVRTR